MSTAAEPRRMTVEEFLALPVEEGVERELMRGELRQYVVAVGRTLGESRATTRIGRALYDWLDTRPEPPGEILAGVGLSLPVAPGTVVGADVAYISAELAAATPEDAEVIDGVPTLVVEILSPTDTQERILEKVDVYLDAGVPLVWLAEPVYRTVTVYRPGADPVLYAAGQEITAEPHLPGFRASVASLFGRRP